MDERRGTKRYDIPLKLNYHDPNTNVRIDSMAKNICKNGLRFVVPSRIPKDTVLDMAIEDPYSEALIHSKAKVVWIQEFISVADTENVSYEVGAKLLKKQLY